MEAMATCHTNATDLDQENLTGYVGRCQSRALPIEIGLDLYPTTFYFLKNTHINRVGICLVELFTQPCKWWVMSPQADTGSCLGNHFFNDTINEQHSRL